jgi:NAD(P)H-hydrate epimerase
MGITIGSRAPTADLVVDALIGYSLRGDPVGAAAQLITWANGQAAPVLALDTPSGLDLTTGTAGAPTVGATATLTLALPKVGLLDAPSTGDLYLADISVPPLVYQRMGIAVPPLFRQSSLLQIGP